MSLERSDTHGTKPTLALAMGDPAGISPELTARLLALDEVRQQARLIVIGDRRVLEQGARVAAVDPDVETIGAGDPLPNRIDRPIFVDLANLDPDSVEPGIATRAGGRFALANYRLALTMGRDARADAVCFTPFNKQAMRSRCRPTTTRSASRPKSSASMDRRASSTSWKTSGTRASPRMCGSPTWRP